MHEGRCHKCGLKGELHPEELEGDLGLWLHVKRELGTMVDCQRNDNLKKKFWEYVSQPALYLFLG